MSHQIIGLRPHPTKPGDIEDFTFFDKYRLTFDSLSEFLDDPEAILSQIPDHEKWNLFFTVANCTSKKREFAAQDLICFDIDKGADLDKADEYHTTLARVVHVPKENIAMLCSGNGLHFYLKLLVPIVAKDFFSQYRDHYKAILGRLNEALRQAGLPGELDPSVWDARRIMRLPGTVNRKVGKKEVRSKILHAPLLATNFDITLASGVPVIKKDQAVDSKMLKAFRVDNDAIFKQCGFMKWVKDSPAEVNEPQWYAALSIIGRMENGREVAHEVSKGHPGYSPGYTDIKLDQSIRASGPRKCTSISQSYEGCSRCPHFQRIESPITLTNPDTIATEKSGFHFVQMTDKGRVIVTPDYDGLRRYFERLYPYKSHDKFIWTWTGTHFELRPDDWIRSFAEEQFSKQPEATVLSKQRHEFLEKLQAHNWVDAKAWTDKCFGKINLQNGVLDTATMRLEPHNREYGFKATLPYDYDPEARAPKFLAFLDEIMLGRSDLTQTILEYFGYALSGGPVAAQKALVMDGSGENGKSTLLDVLKGLVGRGAYSSLPVKLLMMEDRRQSLDGALFNVTEETPNKIWDTADLKTMIGGGEIQVRALYKNVYTIETKAKLIFACNEMPTVTDSTHGFFRRLMIVPFEYRVPADKKRPQHEMVREMLAEAPGILNLCLEAYQRLVDRKYVFSKGDHGAVDKEIVEYKRLSDPVGVWFEEKVVLDPVDQTGRNITTTELFADFHQWAEANGFLNHGKTSVSLGRWLMQKIGGERYGRNAASRFWYNVSLRGQTY
jgi:P4 family phage/plasmid primase-like protien